MNQADWNELKSGTDVRGVALEGVEGEHINLTDEAVSGIMKALCYRLAKSLGKDKLTVAIGHDSRLSADRISKCAADAVTQSGSDVILTGLSSTPSMFMLLQEKDIGADASVMITASHLPYNKNGLKFFLPSGGLEGKDISEILALAAEGKSQKIIPLYINPLSPWPRSQILDWSRCDQPALHIHVSIPPADTLTAFPFLHNCPKLSAVSSSVVLLRFSPEFHKLLGSTPQTGYKTGFSASIP